MFERFTESARGVVVEAAAAARELGHEHIDTGHLLLGVLQSGDERALAALGALGVTDADVRERLGPQAGDGTATGQIPFTAGAKQALEWALRESMELRAKHIAPAHILLALAHDTTSQAAAILRDLGAEPQEVREAVVNTLTSERRRAGLPLPSRSFVEELTLALRHAEEEARRAGRPVDAGDLMLALGVSPAAAYAIRVTNLREAVEDAREGYGRLEQLRRDMRTAFEGGEVAEAERLRDDARRLRDELEGRY